MIEFPEFREAASQLAVGLTGAAGFALLAFLMVALFHRLAAPAVGRLVSGGRVVDRWLAVHVAGWVGLDAPGVLTRWSRLLLTMSCLALAGALTPPLVAIPALIAGLTVVLAVFRRWTWDEEDRALGLEGAHKRAPGAEDFNNEFLIAISTIFLFGSLLIWRLADVQMFSTSHARGLVENLVYVASETLEALPIVGNVEVLGYDNPSGVEAVLPSGGWVAFVLRMALDILVIGGLLKVVEIAGRIAKGQDLRRVDAQLALGGDPAFAALSELYRLSMGGAGAASDRLEAVALGERGEGAQSPDLRTRAVRYLGELSNMGVPGHRHFLDVMLASSVDLLRLSRQDPDLAHLEGLLLKDVGQIRTQLAVRSTGEEALDQLQAATQSLQEALSHFPPGHPHRTQTQLDLGQAAAKLAERLPDKAYKIEFHRLAMEARAGAIADMSPDATPAMRMGAAFQHAHSMGQLGMAMDDFEGHVLVADSLELFRDLRRTPPPLGRDADQGEIQAWGGASQGIVEVLDWLAQRADPEASVAYAREAVAMSRAALAVIEHSHNVVAGSVIQSVLGTTLLKLAGRVTGDERMTLLDEAVLHLEESQLLINPTDAPEVWAHSQRMRGLALSTRGYEKPGEAGVGDLIAGAEALRTLTEFESGFAVWSTDILATHVSLIRCERHLAERTANPALAADALRRIEIVIELMTENGADVDQAMRLKSQLETLIATLNAETPRT